MSDAPIPPVTNGVRGGQAPRGRAHKRNHGLSIPPGHQKASSLSDFVSPSLNAPSTPRSPYVPPSYSSETHTSSTIHTRHHSDLPSFPADLSVSQSPVNSPKTIHETTNPRVADTHMPPAHIVSEYNPSKETDAQSCTNQNSVLQELIVGILVPLPYIVISFLELFASPQNDDLVPHAGLLDKPYLSSCAYVSAILFIIGLYGQIQSGLFNSSTTDRNYVDTERRMPRYSGGVFREGSQRTLSLWLYMYAYSTLGISTLVTVMLVTLLAGLEPLLRSCVNPDTRRQSMFLLKKKKATAVFLGLMIIFDVGISPAHGTFRSVKGYVALALAMSIVPPAYDPRWAAMPKALWPSNSANTGKDYPKDVAVGLKFQQDSPVNLAIGTALGIIVVFVQSLTAGTVPPFATFFSVLAVGLSASVSQIYSASCVLQRFQTPGFMAGAGILLIATGFTTGTQAWFTIVQFLRLALAYISTWIDHRMASSDTHHHSHEAVMHKKPSKASLYLLGLSKQWPLIHAILKERDSRRIFYFMSINFAFMLVQFSYGIATGSLGLLSDSIHMLFDCFALAVGLSAAVMSKWPPSSRFPYGYGKVDTLAGFANGVFLMIISIEIIYEAIERLSSGSEVHRIGELFFVSSAGLAVNMVGIFAFDHAHHGHSHGDHDHGNENMHGIFLHILADALGSVAVISSTILVHFFGWSGWDPIASCLIAILIFVSAVPLVISTSKTLLLALPADVEYSLRDTLAGVSALRGVVGYTVPKFWLDDTVHEHVHKHDHHDHHDHHNEHDHNHDHRHEHEHEHNHSHSHGHSHDHHTHTHSEHKPGSSRKALGVIHIVASRNADLLDVQRRTTDYLREQNMNVLVQVEREGNSTCWCGSNNKAIS